MRTLIIAYQTLTPTERASAPLVIVGGKGWGNLDLPAGTSQLESAGDLRFLGSVSNAQLRSLYEGAIALLFPSVYEGFGMPVVEAMACGTRVVHNEGTSMDEITDDLALRLPARDVDAWSRAMTTLIAEPNIAGDGDRNRRRARAVLFDWHRSAATVRAAYDALMRA